MMKKIILLKSVLVFLALFVGSVMAKDKAEGQSDTKTKTMSEISIIGNTELPNISFDLPWKLPTIAKRAEEKPINALEGMLAPIEPERHRQQVFFNQYLKLDMPTF